jgi:16S rRNA U516 pseudouridylate synthase RsuA-like enzyme
VNGIVAHIGQVVDPETDEIKFSDQIIADQADLVYYVFNKPRDVVTTCLSTPFVKGDVTE